MNFVVYEKEITDGILIFRSENEIKHKKVGEIRRIGSR